MHLQKLTAGLHRLLRSGSCLIIILLAVGITLLSAAPLAGEEADDVNKKVAQNLGATRSGDSSPFGAPHINLRRIRHPRRLKPGDKETKSELIAIRKQRFGKSPEVKPRRKRPVRFRTAKRRLLKRSEDGVGGGEGEEEKEEGWGVSGAASLNQGGSGSGSASNEGYDDGTAPVQGPYMRLAADGVVPIDDEDDGEDKLGGRSAGTGRQTLTKPSYKSWDEYLGTQRTAIKEAVADARSLVEEGSVLRSVIHTDDHFRYMDKLFKDKNDKVKAFHELVLFMKEQGKDFKIPQKPRNILSTSIQEKSVGNGENTNALGNEVNKGTNQGPVPQPNGENVVRNEVKKGGDHVKGKRENETKDDGDNKNGNVSLSQTHHTGGKPLRKDGDSNKGHPRSPKSTRGNKSKKAASHQVAGKNKEENPVYIPKS